MHDSVMVRVPLLPTWGKSLSSPGVTQPQNSRSLSCGHYLKSPVCWPVMLSTQKATRCFCILKCAPTLGVHCPSRQVLFVSFSCWVTPNRSLFTAGAPNGRLQVPSLLSILRWLLFPKHSRTKPAPLGILWAFFFFPQDNFSLNFPSKKDVFALMEQVVWPGHLLGSFVFWVPQGTGERGVGEGPQKPSGHPLWGHLCQRQSGSSSSSSCAPRGLRGP